MHPNRSEAGNAFFYVFLCLAVVSALTFAVTRMSQNETGGMAALQRKEQVSRLLAQAAVLSGAIQQMIINGAEESALAANLSTVYEGAGWDAGPHQYKIYHPYGGGVKYIGQTGTGTGVSSSNLAANFQVRKASYVQGVGNTDSTATPDILFTAQVNSLVDCRAINAEVNGATPAAVPPTVTDDAAAFANLFTDTTGGTDAALQSSTPTCSGCVGLKQSCVQNAGGTLFGYYQVLLAQ